METIKPNVDGTPPSRKIVDPREFDIPSEDQFRIYGVTMETKLNKPKPYDQPPKQQSGTELPEGCPPNLQSTKIKPN